MLRIYWMNVRRFINPRLHPILLARFPAVRGGTLFKWLVWELRNCDQPEGVKLRIYIHTDYCSKKDNCMKWDSNRNELFSNRLFT